MGTVGAVCQAQHCQSHTLPSSTGAGQAASRLLAGVLWDGRGPVGSCYSWWPERLVCFLERRVSLQSMPFVPPRLCSCVRRMGWGRFVVEVFKAGVLSDPLLRCASFLIPRVSLSLVSLGYIIPFQQSC